MYKIILVDDEHLVLKSLVGSINWEEHGFKIAGQSCNSVEALEIIERVKPDFVITDIVMPNVNGLELIKRASAKSKDILFAVISGHAEFAYAQKALTYGAIGYCLKPFDDFEIITMLNKVKEILDKKKLSGNSDFSDLSTDISLYRLHVTGKTETAVRDDEEYRKGDLYCTQMEESTLKMDIKAVQAYLDRLQLYFEDKGMYIKHAVRLFNIIVLLSSKMADKDNSDKYIYNCRQLYDSFADLNEMAICLKAILTEATGLGQLNITDKICNREFKNLLQYVNCNFYADISISKLSQMFYINQSYISQLFKKELGITYCDYLTKLRINHAVKLLEKSDFTINEIAEKCGFNDYFYFMRTFKKVIGCSAAKYRKKK